MKINFKRAFAIGLLVALGCSKPESIKTGTVNDLSPFAKQFIGLNSTANASMSPTKNNSVNQSYQGVMNSYAGATGQTLASDTTIVSNPYDSCSKTLQINNADGSITTTSDYGTGCTQTYGDSQSTIWGKWSSTSKNTSSISGSLFTSNYYYKSNSNEGGRYIYQSDTTTWSSIYQSTYEGQSFYDSAKQTYWGNSDGTDSSYYTYDKVSYTYLSNSKSNYTDKQSVVESSDYSYTSGDNYYHVTVTVPLVYRYDCIPQYPVPGTGVMSMCIIRLPVSGHEVVKYKQDGVEGTFEIDYGNGTCDNKMTIIENGKEIIVDMAQTPSLLKG